MTATQSVNNESMDLTVMASENVVTAVARSVTLSDADVGKFWELESRNIKMIKI